MDIHRSLIKDFVLPKMNSVLVVDYFLTIQNIFESSENFQYEGLLANPRIRTRNEIVWATESFLTKPVLLCDLTGEKRDYYENILVRAIYSIDKLSAEIKDSIGSDALVDLLNLALSYIDDGSVYCADDKIVIVNWGMVPRKTDIQQRTICRKGKLMGCYAGYIDASDCQYKDTVVHDELEEVIFEGTDDGSHEESRDEVPCMDVKMTDDIEPVISDTDQIVTEEAPDADTGETNEGDTVQYIDSAEPISAEDNGRKKRLTNILKISAILLSILALLFLARNCQGPVNVINPFYNPLPAVPAVEPIIDEFVGESTDGMSLIALDRLNIYLDSKGNSTTMLKWAKAFKRAYPDRVYRISYYDPELDFLQIMVPSSERDQIKALLPVQLSEFSFEVYDESVSGSGSEVSDPMMSDPRASWYFDTIDVEGAWQISKGNPDIIVAVVDNGFDSTHPEFEGRISETYNVLTHNSSVWPIETEKGVNCHGTHVAATVAGNCNNGVGLSGIAPECRLMLVQVGADSKSGSLSSTAIREGVKYAINKGADVVNISLGQILSSYEASLSETQQLNYIKNSYRPEEAMWLKLFEMAEKRKCILVLSAGNDDVISGIDPKKRNSSSIIVSALNHSLNKASFSNYGVYPHLGREYSTVSAPGVNIYSAAPNASYVYMDGTSMAAPIVSGSVALLKGLNRNLTAHQVIKILKETGVKAGENIGPMINIGNAVRLLSDKPSSSRVNCRRISKEIKNLRRQLDSLIRLCPEAALPEDTLKFGDAVKKPSTFDGLWRVTASLVSTKDQTPVEMYMKFHDLQGTLTLINSGHEYTAPLKVDITGKSIYIKQLSDARSADGDTFLAYDYSCSSDRNGNLLCSGITVNGVKVEFNLVRVKY